MEKTSAEKGHSIGSTILDKYILKQRKENSIMANYKLHNLHKYYLKKGGYLCQKMLH